MPTFPGAAKLSSDHRKSTPNPLIRSVTTPNKSKRRPTYVRYVGEVEGTGLSELEGLDRLRTLGLVSAPSPGGRAAGADVEQVAPNVALGLVHVVVADAKHCGICGGYLVSRRCVGCYAVCWCFFCSPCGSLSVLRLRTYILYVHRIIMTARMRWGSDAIDAMPFLP